MSRNATREKPDYGDASFVDPLLGALLALLAGFPLAVVVGVFGHLYWLALRWAWGAV